MKKEKKQHTNKPHIVGRFIAAVLVAALSVNGYYGYQMFGKGVAEAASYRGMSSSQKELQQEREAREQAAEEAAYISYTPSASTNDLSTVIVGEEDAETVFGSLRYEMDLTDLDDTFPLSYSRSNDYFDVYTLQQYHAGIEVYGHEIKMTADKAGNLLSVTGDPVALDGFDTTVTLSEKDAYALAEKYLSSEYHLSTETVSIQKKGKRIFLEASDTPSMGYLFEVVMPLGEDFSAELYRIMVYGNEKKVAFVEELTQNVTRSMDLQGQEVMQTLDVDRNEDGNTYLLDYGRGLFVFDALEDNGVKNSKLGDTNNPGAVDFLANAQRAYDFYEENFSCHRDMVQLFVDDAAEDKNETSWYTNGINARASRDSERNGGSISLTRNKTLAIHLDGIGHEYSHVMFPDNVPAETAINEGLADLFGELTEDYSDGGFDNSCNWIFTDKNVVYRNLADPSKSKNAENIDDVENQFKDRGGQFLYYYSSTIVSHSAYLMTQGINSTQALTTEQLANLYYYILDGIHDGSNFIAFRSLVESNALQMNMANYNNGIYTNADDGFVLTDAQFESVVDAFDRVGVERSYEYSLEPDAKIEVYDINNEIYDNYHLSILKSSEGVVVVDEDVKSKKYTLPDLDKGLYQFTLTDLDNADRIETYTVMINDNASGQKSKDYASKGKFTTDFCAMEKRAVLVLDVSGSMDGIPLKETKNAAMKFVKTVLDANPEVKISLITYSNAANTILESSSSKFDLYWAISQLKSGGDTNMRDALIAADRILMQDNIKDKYVIVMSDGKPAASPANVASGIRNNDVTLCSLGFYHSSDKGEILMQSIASPGYYYNVQSASDIQGVFDEIARQVSGEEYTLREFHCPIDIIVSYNGETLCSAEENQNLRTSFGSISFGGEDGETKILRLDNQADYEICVYGTGIGTMDYKVSYVDENGDYTDVRTFEDVQISDETIISTRNLKSAQTVLEVDTDGDGKFDLQYSGKSGELGTSAEHRPWLFAVILPAAILAAWLLLEIVLLIKRDKKNRVCAGCGSPVPKRNTKFCAKCGDAVNTLPLLPKWTKPTGKRKVLVGLQTALVLSCIALTAGTTLIYYSAANTVFLQLRNAELASAEMLYQSSVQEKKVPCAYLSAVTEIYLNRVEKSYGDADISQDTAEAIYRTVAEMEMGTASDTAKAALEETKISQ